jgi:hypothetical protein
MIHICFGCSFKVCITEVEKGGNIVDYEESPGAISVLD